MSIYLNLKVFFIWLCHCGNTVKEQRWIPPQSPRRLGGHWIQEIRNGALKHVSATAWSCDCERA